MNSDTEERINKATLGFKSSLDIGMGVLYILIPIYALLIPSISEQYGKGLVYSLGVLFILYGGFRIYRGIFALQKSLKRNSRHQRHSEDKQ